jgi:hypothetical protein
MFRNATPDAVVGWDRAWIEQFMPAMEGISTGNFEVLAGVADRVDAVALDFFADPIPPADVVTHRVRRRVRLHRRRLRRLVPRGRLREIEIVPLASPASAGIAYK